MTQAKSPRQMPDLQPRHRRQVPPVLLAPLRRRGPLPLARRRLCHPRCGRERGRRREQRIASVRPLRRAPTRTAPARRIDVGPYVQIGPAGSARAAPGAGGPGRGDLLADERAHLRAGARARRLPRALARPLHARRQRRGAARARRRGHGRRLSRRRTGEPGRAAPLRRHRLFPHRLRRSHDSASRRTCTSTWPPTSAAGASARS